MPEQNNISHEMHGDLFEIDEMDESSVIRVYGETIFGRGQAYFEEGRVTNVIKLRGNLVGGVVGTRRYRTEVDLDSLGCECSCPYRINCKHGVAVLLQYFSGEFVDGDEIMKSIENMGIGELKKIIERLVSLNPENLLNIQGKPSNALDKEVKSRLQLIEHTYADEEFVHDFAGFIKVNEDALTKEQIFYVLEFLVRNCEEYGCFYDDYSDGYFGDAIFENLCDAFVKKELEDKDFERLEKLEEKDDYDMLGLFFSGMTDIKNAPALSNFDRYVHKFLDDHSYVEFLINCGKKTKAKSLIEAIDALREESRFRLYLQIDADDAIEFARSKGWYSSLIRYYHEIGEHGEAVGLFKEVVGDKAKKLDQDVYLYSDILDSICKSDSRDGMKDVLRALFEICHSLGYYGLCVDIGMKLDDKELVRRLIEKKKGYYFDTEVKIKSLDYLKDEYVDEVENELKRFAEALIEEKKNYAYEKASDCVFLLRKIMGKEKWGEYLKELYSVHSRKINLWREFTRKGVHLKTKNKVVMLEDKYRG